MVRRMPAKAELVACRCLGYSPPLFARMLSNTSWAHHRSCLAVVCFVVCCRALLCVMSYACEQCA